MTKTSQHSEIERKFEGRSGTPVEWLLDPNAVKGISGVVDLRPKSLRATYYDTSDLGLAARGVTLRQRSGGDDGGWHLKVPVRPGEKLEVRVTPRDATDTPPGELASDVQALTRGDELVPVMAVRTQRREFEVFDRRHRSLAVVSVDEVTAEPARESQRSPGGSSSPARWSEWEVELLDDGDEAVLDRISRRLIDSGLRASRWPSKLEHALAATAFLPDRSGRVIDPPPVRSSRARRPTGGQVVVAHLREQTRLLELRDVGVRCGMADAVHQMRVTTRRLRSALATFRPLLAGGRWDHVRGELKWLGEALGNARDAEVMRARLDRDVGSLPIEQVLGPVRSRIDRTMGEREAESVRALLAVLKGERYMLLLDELDSLAADPPLSSSASGKSEEVLAPLVRKAGRRVRRAHRAFEAARDTDQSDVLLHDVRKAAKRSRYAAEATAPALGRRARHLALRMEDLQGLLGEHQDAVAAGYLVRELGVQAHLSGENGFTFGALWAIEHEQAKSIRGDYHRSLKPALAAIERF